MGRCYSWTVHFKEIYFNVHILSLIFFFRFSQQGVLIKIARIFCVTIMFALFFFVFKTTSYGVYSRVSNKLNWLNELKGVN